MTVKDNYSSDLVEFFEKISSWEKGVVEGREISLSQMHLLEVVGNRGSLRMKDLSEKLSVTTGTLTVMVQRLVSKGYLIKERDNRDRRSCFLSLSDKGRSEYENHHHMHEQLIEEILDVLGDGDSQIFFAMLSKLQEKL